MPEQALGGMPLGSRLVTEINLQIFMYIALLSMRLLPDAPGKQYSLQINLLPPHNYVDTNYLASNFLFIVLILKGHNFYTKKYY